MNPTLILWIGGVFVLILIGVGIYFTISSQKSEEEQRIGDYIEPKFQSLNRRKPPIPCH
jgi:cytochrome c-type biogenesis protein CcmH/NrfF